MSNDIRSSRATGSDLEVNLLPTWYPTVVRRRRWLIAQGWGTACLVVVLGTLLLLRQDDEQSSLRTLAAIAADREATERQLAEVARFETELRELTRSAEAVEQVGLPVGVAPLLAELAGLIPDDAVLTEISFVEAGAKLPAALEKSKLKAMAPTSKWLDVQVSGIAQKTSDVARLLEQIQSNRLHREAAIAYLQETDEAGETAMQFQIRFKIMTERGAASTAVASAK